MPIHAVDLAQKGMSAGELRNVAARVGGMEALIDREGARYVAKGLKYAAPTGPRIEAAPRRRSAAAAHAHRARGRARQRRLRARDVGRLALRGEP